MKIFCYGLCPNMLIVLAIFCARKAIAQKLAMSNKLYTCYKAIINQLHQYVHANHLLLCTSSGNTAFVRHRVNQFFIPLPDI